ncbi:MAG: hypothetical protein KDD61_12830 [Bdellovibrionales bacterium]|nr:hypothetical protein [Bdellovibrionales bacterium]
MHKNQTSVDNIKKACQEVEEAFQLFIKESRDENLEDVHRVEKPSPTMKEIQKTLAKIKGQIDELSK